MGRVPAAVGHPSTQIQGYDPFRLDGTVEIVCEEWNTGARRNAYPGTQKPDRIRDMRYSNMREYAVSAGSTFCDPTDFAVTYSTSSTRPGDPHHVVLLCDSSWLSKDKFRIKHRWADQWDGEDYDTIGAYTSVTIVHEFMHCLPGNLAPAVLPSGAFEKYDYGDILMLQDGDKRANAEGFAKMAVGMWLRFNTMSSADMKMGRKFTRNNRPGRGPHMYGLRDEPPPIP